MQNVTLGMLYNKLDYLQKKVDEIENLMLVGEVKLTKKEMSEISKTRAAMLAGKEGKSLSEIDDLRKARV